MKVYKSQVIMGIIGILIGVVGCAIFCHGTVDGIVVDWDLCYGGLKAIMVGLADLLVTLFSIVFVTNYDVEVVEVEEEA